MSTEKERFEATVNLESALLRWFVAHDIGVDTDELEFINEVFNDLDLRLGLGRFP